MKPTRLAAFSTVTGLALGLSLACGGFGAGSGSSDVGSYVDYGPAPAGADRFEARDRAFRVAPDRGLVAVSVRVEGPSSAEAARTLSERVAAVTGAVAGGGTGCAAEAVDYDTPSGAGDTWTAGGEVRVDVDLRGLADVPARRERLAACLSPMDPLLTPRGWRKVGGSAEEVVRSPVLLSVDAPDTHRDTLLARERERLGWAAAAAGAPQLHPEDLRCVPDGRVHAGDRDLSGITLTLGMDCRIEGAEAEDEDAASG